METSITPNLDFITPHRRVYMEIIARLWDWRDLYSEKVVEESK